MNDITFIPACAHDSNGIPTAVPMFPRSGHMAAIKRTLSAGKVNGKSKMASINPEV